MNTRTIQTGLLVVAVVVIALIVVWAHPAPKPAAAPQPVATVAFSCDNAQGIIATFYDGSSTPAVGTSTPPTPGGSVQLTLMDKRVLTLAQTISADGARYASADGSFVFWGKGNTAIVQENGQPSTTYRGCIVVAPEPSGTNLPLIFSNSGAGFSIRLPQGYSVDASYHYQPSPTVSIPGIKFTIAPSVATGTNLASDTYLSVEEIAQKNPTATSCSANLFLPGTKAMPLTDGDFTYSVATSTDAGAGNRYAQTVFAMPGTNPCIGVRYYIHYGVFENYPAGSIQEFNQALILAGFDAIRHTLVLAQPQQ